MLMLPDERYCAVLMAAAGCQGVKLDEKPARAVLKYMAGYDGVLLVTDDLKLKLHAFADKNDHSNDKTVSAMELAELADKLCGDLISYEAASREDDWLVALLEAEQDRRYISRAIVACDLAR